MLDKLGQNARNILVARISRPALSMFFFISPHGLGKLGKVEMVNVVVLFSGS